MKVRDLIDRLRQCPDDAAVDFIGENSAGDLIYDAVRMVVLNPFTNFVALTNGTDEDGWHGSVVIVEPKPRILVH